MIDLNDPEIFSRAVKFAMDLRERNLRRAELIAEIADFNREMGCWRDEVREEYKVPVAGLEISINDPCE